MTRKVKVIKSSTVLFDDDSDYSSLYPATLDWEEMDEAGIAALRLAIDYANQYRQGSANYVLVEYSDRNVEEVFRLASEFKNDQEKRRLKEQAAEQIAKQKRDEKARANETGDEPTSDFVRGVLAGRSGYDIASNDEDVKWAKQTTDHFRKAVSFGNDYLDNIRVLMKEDIVRKRHAALLVSAVLACQRELANKAKDEKAACNSDFVGNVKERIRDLALTIIKISSLGYGQYGPSYLHLMEDAGGNVFSWVTGSKIEQPEGSEVKIDASVKEHKVYNNVKQTVLTRCRVK
jgi:hypothetical protein